MSSSQTIENHLRDVLIDKPWGGGVEFLRREVQEKCKGQQKVSKAEMRQMLDSLIEERFAIARLTGVNGPEVIGKNMCVDKNKEMSS